MSNITGTEGISSKSEVLSLSLCDSSTIDNLSRSAKSSSILTSILSLNSSSEILDVLEEDLLIFTFSQDLSLSIFISEFFDLSSWIGQSTSSSSGTNQGSGVSSNCNIHPFIPFCTSV